eukprot:COSAG04_NODE_330_length_16594_cov_25.794146_2_plen_301_part_00
MSKAEVEALKAQVAELTSELQRVRLPPRLLCAFAPVKSRTAFGGAGAGPLCEAAAFLAPPSFSPGRAGVFLSPHTPPVPRPAKTHNRAGPLLFQVHVLSSSSAHFRSHLRVPSCRTARCAPPGLRPGGPDGRGVQGRTAGRPAQVWHLRQQRQPDRRGAALLLRLRLAACRHPARPDGADHAVGHALRDLLRRRQVHGPRRGPRRPRRHPAGARPRRPRHPDPVRQHGGRRGQGRLVLPLPAALGRRVRHPLGLLPAALHQPGWPPRLRRRAQRQRYRRGPGRDQGLHRQHGGDLQGAGR